MSIEGGEVTYILMFEGICVSSKSTRVWANTPGYVPVTFSYATAWNWMWCAHEYAYRLQFDKLTHMFTLMF